MCIGPFWKEGEERIYFRLVAHTYNRALLRVGLKRLSRRTCLRRVSNDVSQRPICLGGARSSNLSSTFSFLASDVCLLPFQTIFWEAPGFRVRTDEKARFSFAPRIANGSSAGSAEIMKLVSLLFPICLPALLSENSI